MTLELSTSFKRITTSPKSARGLAPQAAVAKAKAAAAYVMRSDAAAPSDITWCGGPIRKALDATPEQPGEDADARKTRRARAVRLCLGKAAEEHAAKGGKNGAGVATTLMVSLPNSWPANQQRNALYAVCRHLAPPGSEAMAMGAIHRDKPGNIHMHIIAVDGLESLESAKARAAERAKANPGTKPRVRRQLVQEMNAGGKPKELRRSIAQILNTIAEKHGLEQVEWRSLKARGIDRDATTHDGPTKRARARKAADAIAQPTAEPAPATALLDESAGAGSAPLLRAPDGTPWVPRPGGIREAAATAAKKPKVVFLPGRGLRRVKAQPSPDDAERS